MTRAYEFAVVLNPELSDAELERLGHSIKSLIEKNEGKVINEDIWGRKPTAYKLRGHREGFYAFFDIEMAPQNVFAFDQAVKLTEGVLRHLITIKEE